jgi:hypothetical protein
MRAALHDADGLIVNVIELPDDWTLGAPDAYEPPDGVTVMPLDADAPVGPGWVLDQHADPQPPDPPAAPDPLQVLATLQQQVTDALAKIAELTAQLGATTTPETNGAEA